jgi:hypothetical protein
MGHEHNPADVYAALLKKAAGDLRARGGLSAELREWQQSQSA